MLDEVPADSIAVTQETFGPIAPIMSISSLEDAIEQTNVQNFGLMAAIFTADLGAGMRYADAVHMGPREHQRDHELLGAAPPMGRPSALGGGIGRVGGPYPMDTLTELQTVTDPHLSGPARNAVLGDREDGRAPGVQDLGRPQGERGAVKTPESGDQGMFLGGDPSYVQKDKELIEALDLNLKHVTAGAEPA